MEEQKEKAKSTVESRFTKTQLLKSERYKNQRDILDVMLDENGLYSHKEAESKIEEFLKGSVD